jgi:hypothetical protein
MVTIAHRYASRLDEIKNNVKQSRLYFKKNVDMYRTFVRMVFSSSITSDKAVNLSTLNKPAIEFNILEAMISRLRGEFAKQEPSISVRAADGVPLSQITDQLIDQMEVVESYMREILLSSNNDNLQYNIFSDMLAGGYSAAKISVDYTNELSFDYQFKVERVFDPKMVGFDPMARESHCGDGDYCYEIIPMKRDAFEKEFGRDATKNMEFSKTFEGFQWSYRNEYETQDTVIVVDYYEKVKKKIKIAKLTNGHVINRKHYEELVEMWNMSGMIEQAPQIVEERYTIIDSIDRYRVCESQILEHVKTDYDFLPIIMFDGNSIEMQEDESSPNYRMTRPFVYHAAGIQQLINFAGQCVGAELQNMVEHKWVAALESIPDNKEYQKAYVEPQIASVLVYNAFYNKNPEVPLPPPREVVRTPTPQIVQDVFFNSNQMTQMILGSYDTVLGTNANQLSGKAIQQGALQSNGAAIPYLVGYIKGLNRVAQCILSLIPKYVITPRTIPVRRASGRRGYQLINHEGHPESTSMNFDPKAMQVKVEAGVNSTIQKQVALEEITSMMNASPVFAEFINTMGLETLLDNMDIRGIDYLKQQAIKFMEQVEAAKQNPPPPSEAQILAETQERIEMARIEAGREKAQGEQATATARVSVEKQNADTKFLELMAMIEDKNRKADLDEYRVASEDARESVEMTMDIVKGLMENRVNE